MLLTCPQCATSYRVDSAALGAQGRSVRCTRCGIAWFAEAMAEPAGAGTMANQAGAAQATADASEVAAFRQELGEATMDPAAAEDGVPPVTAATAVSAETPADPPGGDAEPQSDLDGDGAAGTILPMAEAPPLAPDDEALAEPQDAIESVARRHRRSSISRRARHGPLPVVIAGLAALLIGLLVGRETVVSHAPQTASLYAAIGLPVNLRGLALEDVATSRGSHDGVPLLVVEGSIVNVRATAVEVPRLRFAVLDRAGGEIYVWTAQPPKTVLEPKGSLPFRSRLASPPEGAHSVMVRFFHRRDALADQP